MAEVTPKRNGKLKVFLGYAAGVGKTYQMLEEAQQLKQQGHDVVVGYFEPHGRQDTIERMEGLELHSQETDRISRTFLRGDGYGRDSGAPARDLRRGRIPSYQRPRLAPGEALGRRA